MTDLGAPLGSPSSVNFPTHLLIVMERNGLLTPGVQGKPYQNYFPPRPTSRNKNSLVSLETLLDDKIRTLSTILSSLGQEIKERHSISRCVLGDITHDYLSVSSELLGLQPFVPDANPFIEGRRLDLEKRLDNLRRETRNEQVLRWQDTAHLNREFRTWFKQHRDLSQRIAILITGAEKRRTSSAEICAEARQAKNR